MYIAQSLYGPPGNISSCAFWVDLFAINQHKQVTEQLEEIDQAIKDCERTAIVLDESAVAPTRVWCIYELWITLREKHPIDVIFAGPNGTWTVLNALCVSAGPCAELDVRKAESTKMGDKDGILERIESSTVNIDTVNNAVRQALSDAARDEVVNKAHVPRDIMEEATAVIERIGWRTVLSSSAERERVIRVFADHVAYGRHAEPNPNFT